MIASEMVTRCNRRTEPDERAFREARWLLFAFGISAIPATLVLGLMGVDFLEGDFGLAGTVVMALAGGASFVCVLVSIVAQRRWAAGEPLWSVLGVVWWPLLLMLIALFVATLAFAAEFSLLWTGQ